MVRGGHVPPVSDYVITSIWAVSASGASEWGSAGIHEPLTQGIQARSLLAIIIYMRRLWPFQEPIVNDETYQCSPLLRPYHSLPRPKHQLGLSSSGHGCLSRKEYHNRTQSSRKSSFRLRCPCPLNVYQNSLTGSIDVALIVSIASCAESPCLPPSEVLGYVMYQGPYKPIYYQSYDPPHENFTVTIPSGFPKGPAQLNIAHFALVGVCRFFVKPIYACNLFSSRLDHSRG